MYNPPASKEFGIAGSSLSWIDFERSLRQKQMQLGELWVEVDGINDECKMVCSWDRPRC